MVFCCTALAMVRAPACFAQTGFPQTPVVKPDFLKKVYRDA